MTLANEYSDITAALALSKALAHTFPELPQVADQLEKDIAMLERTREKMQSQSETPDHSGHGAREGPDAGERGSPGRQAAPRPAGGTFLVVGGRARIAAPPWFKGPASDGTWDMLLFVAHVPLQVRSLSDPERDGEGDEPVRRSTVFVALHVIGLDEDDVALYRGDRWEMNSVNPHWLVGVTVTFHGGRMEPFLSERDQETVARHGETLARLVVPLAHLYTDQDLESVASTASEGVPEAGEEDEAAPNHDPTRDGGVATSSDDDGDIPF